jgi:pimeloyl-ACP methyl ester carboxylesterase
MPTITANGIPLYYEAHGPADGEPMLLIMGLGAQMTRWPLGFIELLTAQGHHVVAFDNRDCGLSHRFDAAGPADMAAIYGALLKGERPSATYLLSDMAADAVGLLDALGIAKAHIVGASMGGMIAQMVAAEHPDRVLSLTSIMSTTGNPAVPPATPEASQRLTGQAPDPKADLDAFLDYGMASAKVIGSPGYPVEDAEQRAQLLSDYERAFYPVGTSRQMAAIVASGDRRAALASIAAPTVVIHGTDDPLVPKEGGQDTAATIPGAELHLVPGMGHNLPKALWGPIAELIALAPARARVSA